MQPVLVMAGGFLGSGKTTLLLEAASRLRQSGLRVALITNDQGGALVDTRLAEASGFPAQEISGGCFCCRFADFADAIDSLLEHAPDVILAEPVGSCTDLAATVLQRIKHWYGDRLRLAPFTVLVDPGRAREPLEPALAYLFAKQIEEADLLCFSKADLYSEFPDMPARRLSAVTGEGVAEWLQEVLAGSPGGRALVIDYKKYGEAEAALGWLNWQAEVRLRRALSPAALAGPLLERLDEALAAAGIEIAHLKLFDQAATGYIKASLCRTGEEPRVQGALDASPAVRHELLLNLRARSAPEPLAAIVEKAAAGLPGRVTVAHFEAFRPAPPVKP